MTTNPIQNALFAIAYIAVLVSGVFYGGDLLGDSLKETIFLPMGFLATFVLSAAVMGYLFLYTPLLLILDGKRQEGTQLFLKTVGAFAVATALLLITALLVGTFV